MCFSAGASFAGGIVIAAAGIATIRKVRKPSQMLFASIPLLFALQQFSEGVVWVTLRSGGNSTIQYAATLVFMVTALIVWPVLMPLAAFKMESIKIRKRILVAFLTAGVVVSAYYAFCMVYWDFSQLLKVIIFNTGATSRKALRNPVFALYVIATIPPLFISA
ncbi:MAG: hypothetical protein MZU91_14520 [Desulfosudis oleivorans]|nr:hypothetical protein [Desulfosudis oleivorans]